MMFRLAARGEASHLAQIEQLQPLSAGWGKNGFETELDNRYAQIWVCAQGEKMMGFVALRAVAGVVEILNVAVEPQSCGRGVGSALLSHVLTQLKAQGNEQVSLEVNATNLPALRLYRKVGFKEVGRRPKFYWGLEDALIMGKQL